MLDIYTLGEEVLREECQRVDKFDSALKLLSDAMVETLVEADGVGLAGPQVGVNKQIFIVKLPGEEAIAFVNPTIVQTSVETGHYEEGCLSIPGLYHDVVRPIAVTIQYQDLNGKAKTLKADGLLARVIQHENDHLHGKLYIDHLSPEDKEKMIRLYERKNASRRRGKKRV